MMVNVYDELSHFMTELYSVESINTIYPDNVLCGFMWFHPKAMVMWFHPPVILRTTSYNERGQRPYTQIEDLVSKCEPGDCRLKISV